MKGWFAMLFGLRAKATEINDETAHAIHAAVEQHKRASANLEDAVRGLIKENQRLRFVCGKAEAKQEVKQ